jgi:hypothetical protein
MICFQSQRLGFVLLPGGVFRGVELINSGKGVLGLLPRGGRDGSYLEISQT